MTALDHQVIVKELPKTKQAHLIRLDSGTVTMLRGVRTEQAQSKLRLGQGYHDEDYVFAQFDGRAPPMQSDAAERVANLIRGT